MLLLPETPLAIAQMYDVLGTRHFPALGLQRLRRLAPGWVVLTLPCSWQVCSEQRLYCKEWRKRKRMVRLCCEHGVVGGEQWQ